VRAAVIVMDPKVADRVADVLVFTALVVTVNVPEVLPAAIVSVDGTVAAA
jgi:hypothetical protein